MHASVKYSDNLDYLSLGQASNDQSNASMKGAINLLQNHVKHIFLELTFFEAINFPLDALSIGKTIPE